MGNRANIVLIDHDGWQLRYSHWAGCRILDALLAGPEMATRYILAQQTSEFWTDELWSDGGLVLDLTARRLLFFGEELMVSANERRATFEVLAILWPGYSISWAFGATAEIAAYVGAPLPLRDSASEPELKLSTDTDHLHHLVTVAQGGQLRAWQLRWGSSAAWHGPRLLDLLPTSGARSLRLGIIPESGVHVDVAKKALGVWVTDPVPGLLRWLPRLWPGWRIEFWEDRYEEHLRRCAGHVTVPELDICAGINEVQSWLQKRVFQSHAESPAGRLESLVARIEGEGLPSPTVTPAAVTGAGDRPTQDEWRSFERACALVRARTRAA